MKLSYKRTFFVGLAFLSICSFWQLYDGIVPLILKNTFSMRDGVIGPIMAIDNVLGLFLLPLVGAFSDKVKTPFGKRTPFIVIGTIVAVIAMSFIPMAGNTGNLPMFLIALGIVLVTMACYRTPAVALMPDVTPKPLRSMANAIINLMGAVGGVYALVMIILLTDKDTTDYGPVFMSISAVMIVAILFLVLTIRENKLANEVKNIELAKFQVNKDNTNASSSLEIDDTTVTENTKMPKEVRRSLIFILASIFLWFTAYNAVITAFSRYTNEVWHTNNYAQSLLVATIAAIVSYIPIGIISGKIGRKKTIMIGILMMTLSYLSGGLLINYSPVINVIFAFTGIGWAAISVNSYPMVVEMCKGPDVGKYTGLYYTTSMSAQIITPILSGFLLEVSYRTLFPYALIFSFASLCTMLHVKHGDSKPMKKESALENFDTAD